MKLQRANPPGKSCERGQTFLVIAIFIAAFVLVMLGVAADYTQVWAHRQMAQGAADAACQAGAADLFLQAEDPSVSGTNGVGSFGWIGSSYDCSSNAGSPPCKYAALNGYSGSHVQVSFPSSLPGVSSIPSGFGSIAHPYIEVKITDPVSMSFTKLISAGSVNMTAKAGCGLNPVAVPIPLVVMHPSSTGSFSTNGTPTVTIIGGPNRSIQVDSSSATAVSIGGSSSVNLTQAGPNLNGADFGVFGQESKPGGVSLGVGNWVSPASPFGDPWVTYSAPSRPTTAGTAAPVPLGMNGCPDPAGCVEFTPGDYTSCQSGSFAPGGNGCLMLKYGGSNPRFSLGGTNWVANKSYTVVGTLIQPQSNNAGQFVFKLITTGTSAVSAHAWNQTTCTPQSDGTCSSGTQLDGTATWQNVGKVSTAPNTAIFDPGLYYVGAGGLKLASGSSARMSTATGDGNKGATFYLGAGGSTATLAVDANSGSSSACTSASAATGSGSPNNCIVSYKIDGSRSSQATGYVASRQLQCPGGPPNPSQVPTTIDGNILLGPCSGTYGDSAGLNRGFLFFQNRATAASPSWGGGAGFILSGFMYFHNSSNGTTLSLSGGSSSNSFALGNIVVDKISLGGNSGIKMILNPQVTFEILRPTLLE